MKFTPWMSLPKTLPLSQIGRLHELMLKVNHGSKLVDYALGSNKQEWAGRFELWPASLSKHHVRPNGLLEHTLQVCEMADSIFESANKWHCKSLNKDVVLTAALFHDLGKMYDYSMKQRPGSVPEERDAQWVESDHYQKIHHIVKSNDMWKEACRNLSLTSIEEEVSHCILAHHGKLEYGSPVKPATQEAWIVHLADSASVNTIETRWKN